MAAFELGRKGVASDVEGEIVESPEEIRKMNIENASSFLFNCLVWIAAVSPLYFPEDQQKEARVLIKEVKEKLRKLRSMLGVKHEPITQLAEVSDSKSECSRFESE